MVSNLTAKGRKLVIIVDPHVKREAGYFLHEDMTENGYYVKNKDGNDYEGICTHRPQTNNVKTDNLNKLVLPTKSRYMVLEF